MSSESKATPQALFVEAQIREGFSLEAIKVWQALCRNVAVLKNDAEETMHGVLAICDDQGISPMQVCQVILDAGFKTAETGIDAALAMFFEKEASDDGNQDDEAQPEWSDDEHGASHMVAPPYNRELFSQAPDF